VTCHTTDPAPRQGGRTMTEKTATVLTTARIWSWIPEGLSTND